MIIVTGAFEQTWAEGASIAPDKWSGSAPKLARMDRLCGLGMVAASSVLGSAELTPSDPMWNGGRIAIVFGTAYGCHATNEEYYRRLRNEGPSPRLFAYTLPSSPGGEISIHHRITGPAITLTSGRTAGLDALAEGYSLIETGRADRAIVIAAEVSTPLLRDLVGIADVPDAAAALLIERSELAEARGARSRGELVGYAKRFNAAAPALAARDASRSILNHASAAELEVNERMLGAGPLVAAARFFLTPSSDFALIAVADPDGSGAAALLKR